MLRLGEIPATHIMLELLDGLLLIFVFVELLDAVRTSLRSRELVRRAVLDRRHPGVHQRNRRGVGRSANLFEKGPEFAHALVQVGVLGGLVLVLAITIFVLRLQLGGADHLRDRPDDR